MFLTKVDKFVCVSVCVCVCVCVCLSVCLSLCLSLCLSVVSFVARWLHSATWCQVRSILPISTRNCNICQDVPFPDPDYMDQPDHITVWPIAAKLMYGFTPNFICLFSSRDTKCVADFEILS